MVVPLKQSIGFNWYPARRRHCLSRRKNSGTCGRHQLLSGPCCTSSRYHYSRKAKFREALGSPPSVWPFAYMEVKVTRGRQRDGVASCKNTLCSLLIAHNQAGLFFSLFCLHTRPISWIAGKKIARCVGALCPMGYMSKFTRYPGVWPS